MKLIFAVFATLVFNLFANVGTTPSWYLQRENSSANIYIGYGSAPTELEAKQIALSDIVSQISVKVSSSVNINKKVVDGKLSSAQEFSTKQDASASLSDYVLKRSELYAGKYFVAIEYENIPSLDKFARKLKKTMQLKEEKQNSYISNTLIAKRLKNKLGLNINFALLRKDEKWFIKYKEILQPLDKKDFGTFFSSKAHNGIVLNTNKKNNILYENDEFYFHLKSLQNGFASILTVYEDGTVSTLVRNIPVKANKLESIPDKDFEAIPQAGLMIPGVETYDLYVAIVSPKKLRFDNFAYADEEMIEEEKYKNFDLLIEYLDDKQYTTLKVVTKPR